MKALLTLLLAVSGALLGTRDLPAQAPAERPATTTTNASSTNRATADPDGRVGGYVLDDKHKLASGDKISFRIVEDRDPAVSLPVTDSGELDVPYVGRVKVAGKTCKDLQQALKVLLEQEYYYQASVIIGLDAVSKVRGKVYVMGYVRNVGAIDLPAEEDFTAGKAILRAGGFGDFAKTTKVKLVRTNADGKKEEFELNMEDILEKGKTELDKSLKDGDFIIVPARLILF